MKNIKKNNRPTAKDFHVHEDSVLFTDEHLQRHLNVFNAETQPEYFTDFEHKGLTYFDTVILDREDLDRAKTDKFGNQKYRKSRSKKYNDIKRSVETEGVDLRKKPIQAVVTMNEHDKIVNVEHVFNGNTMKFVLDKSRFENRIVAVYTKNRNFSIPNLTEIGANQNALEKPFSPADDTTLEHCLRTIIEDGGYPISNNPTEIEITEWTQKLYDALEFMGGGYKMDSAKSNTFVADLLNQETGSTMVRTVSSGIQVIEHLRNKGYVDTPTVKYGCIAAHYKGVLPHFQSTYKKYSVDIQKGEKDYFDFTKGHYEAIIHGGAPDMTKPVDSWFNLMIAFWDYFQKLVEFTSPNGFLNGADMKIIGAFQPLQSLDSVWPMDSVVPFEEIVEYYDLNKGNLTPTLKTEDEVQGEFDIDSLEEFEIAA